MALKMSKFVHTCRSISLVLLLTVVGCASSNEADVLTGHFYTTNASGTIRIWLKSGNRMQETVVPKYGPSRTIEGNWRLDGIYVEFNPFIEFGARSPVVHQQWRALAQYDISRNLDWFIDGDKGLYFEREHPFTLSALSDHSLAVEAQEVVPIES